MLGLNKMAKSSSDTLTLDLLEDWTPPEAVHRFEDERVRASGLRHKIARAVSETLRDSSLTRDTIADKMSEWLGEEVTRNMLDAYASLAREAHTIPYLRLLALTHVTGDVRLLQMGAELFAHIVVDVKYQEWIRVGQEADRRDQARRIQETCEREFDLALRSARKGRA